MKAFKYFVFFAFFFFSSLTHAAKTYKYSDLTAYSLSDICSAIKTKASSNGRSYTLQSSSEGTLTFECVFSVKSSSGSPLSDFKPFGSVTNETCPSATSVDLKVSTSSGSYVCTAGCQYKLKACVDVDFESGMTCSAISTGQDCGTPKPTQPSTNPPVTQDPTNPTDKTEEQTIFENIMNVIGDKLDSIKDAINGGNQNQDGDTGGSTGGNTGGDVNVNVDMSETNAKIDETNSLIDELTKWLQGEDLGDDIFGDSEPPEKELTPQQLDTNIFSGRAQCPADARLSFNLLGGKTFTKTFEFTDWCDNLEIFGSLILIASYLFGAYIIVSKS
ncbi:virulence factor TspB C-terminal domain-related protein [Acinetobacter johnsonii]|uniref:Virulence factor TspB C-terminal domain-related protein n=1 Tax=Acinetobacter johnsonii TaxID=40214 RepID=A0AA42MUV1_ACIJO|nr:virulence factor TspB C-terminal domain-related protein [Acinetobacter johnsonii]MDH0969145.1 virulence factor TspB C-terminal domain-related protein [Acinetobacter johnsonii]